MKKSFKELMQDCPKHDHAYVLYNHRWNRVKEHELRYICLLVARGELPSNIEVKYLNGKRSFINDKGFLDEIHGNIFSLSGELYRQKLRLIRDEVKRKLM